jgi:hypothetical protein
MLMPRRRGLTEERKGVTDIDTQAFMMTHSSA